MVQRFALSPRYFADRHSPAERCAMLSRLSRPRNPACVAGEMGTDIVVQVASPSPLPPRFDAVLTNVSFLNTILCISFQISNACSFVTFSGLSCTERCRRKAEWVALENDENTFSANRSGFFDSKLYHRRGSQGALLGPSPRRLTARRMKV